MFRLNKRNYSLRDSPIKLAACINSPTKVQASPLKRLKLSDNSYQLSSTFLRDSQIEPEDDSEKIEPLRSLIKSPEKPITIEGNKQSAPIETPPPTPDNTSDSILEVLSKKKAKLLQVSKEIEQKLEEKLVAITITRTEIAQVNVKKFEFDDLMEIVNKGQHEVRDQLNQIFHPGTELANKASGFAEDLRQKHQKKYDKVELELNSLIEKSQKAIIDKICNLKHEITLHERTLMTLRDQELQEQTKNEATEKGDEQKIEPAADTKKGEPEDRGEATNHTTESNRDEDCVIVDEHHSIVSMESVEEVILEVGDLKNDENVDDESTDIEDNQGEDTRSFTPCQAQRPE